MRQTWPPKRRVLGSAILAFILAVFSCVPAVAPHTRASGTTILRVSDEGGTALLSLEPPLALDLMVLGLIFGGLVGLDKNLQTVPEGSDRWSISPDGRVYTFHIRSGLRMGDGTPVTAEDFAWSLNRALAPQFTSGPAWYYLSNIQGSMDVTNKKAAWAAGIKVLTPSELQITLIRPSSVFLQQLAFPTSYVVPRALIARLGDRWTDVAVGTGPFRIKQWRHKQEIVLEPNPYYWRGHLALGELDIPLTDPQAAFALYHTDGVDVMGAIAFPSNRLTQARALPGYHEQHLLLTDYLEPNIKQAPLNNVKVRQALSATIDRYALVQQTLRGAAFPASGILPPGLPGFNPALRGQTYNPSRGRELLAAAGYPHGKGLPPITLVVDESDPDLVRESAALQAGWKAQLGITVTIKRVSDHGAYVDALTAHRFQLAFQTWAADYPDPQDVLSLQLQTGAAANTGGYTNATFDRLTRRADVTSPSDQARYALYQQAEQIAVDDAAWMVLDWGRSAVLIRPTVQGLVVTSNGVMAPDWTQVMVR
jgi:ABC-type oligopeptide transport system substrate-binding subunit